MGLQDFISKLVGEKKKLYEDGDPGTGFDYSQVGRPPVVPIMPPPGSFGGSPIPGPTYMPEPQALAQGAAAAAPAPAPPMPKYNPGEGEGTLIQGQEAIPQRPMIPTIPDPNAPTPDPNAPPPQPALEGPTTVYGDRGQPRRAEGGATELENQEAYLRALQGYKPEDHNGRLKSALIGLGRGYLRGGVAGGIIGAGQGAIDPGVDERYQNEVDIAKTSRSVKSEYDREQHNADVKYRQAQAERALNPQYKPDLVKGEDGTYSTVSGTRATPVYNPNGSPLKGERKQGTTKTEIRHDPITGKAEKWEVGQGGKPDTKVEGWADPAKDMVKVNGRWVSQGTAVTADALASGRTYSQNRDAFKDQQHTTERNEDIARAGADKEQARRKDSARLAGIIDGAKQKVVDMDKQIEKATRDVAAAPDPETQADAQSYLDKLKYQRTLALREATEAVTELNGAHNDLYEAGIGEGGYPYYKIRPFSKSQWRSKYPKASKEMEKANIEAARARSQEIVD